MAVPPSIVAHHRRALRDVPAGPRTEAPIIFADGITTAGITAGVFYATLETTVFTQGADGTAIEQRQVVAHLRLALSGVAYFKEQLDKVEFVVTPAQGEKQ